MLIAIFTVATSQLVAPSPPPPPIVASEMPRPSPPPTPVIVEFALGEVRCRGERVAATQAVRPLPLVTLTPLTEAITTYQIAFRIDLDGRPLGISEANRVGSGRGYFLSDNDLVPALATSRFAAGSEGTGCVASTR